MSLKIQIPKISVEYRQALITHLLTLPEYGRADFYKLLNQISGYCQDVEVSMTLSGMGGARTIPELLASTSDAFQLATYTEFLNLCKLGYSGGDFQHIFLDAYLSTVTDILCAHIPEEE